MMKDNLRHWYDGMFYHKFINPHQQKMYSLVESMMGRGCTVLDVACATGGFEFRFADKCRKIVGIDLSEKNISTAETLLKESGRKNIEFIHGNALEIGSLINEQFEFSFISYALHEMPPGIRLEVIKQMMSVSDKVMFADYQVPQPNMGTGAFNFVVEFFAGWHHFLNYRDYVKVGGIKYYIEKSGLKIKKEIKNPNWGFNVLLTEKVNNNY